MISGPLANRIKQCSIVIGNAPLGKLCSSLISKETSVDRKTDIIKAYIHDFVHCMYMPIREKEFMVRFF